MSVRVALVMSIALSWGAPGIFREPVALAADAGVKKAKITWKKVENAEKYEFELSQNRQMDPILEKKTYPATQTTLPLKPGTYYFRVRGVDQENFPGPWSEVQGFVVNQAAPRLMEPKNHERITRKMPEAGIHLKWQKGSAGSTYLVEIRDQKGSVLTRTTEDTELNWKPASAGPYKWRVGYPVGGNSGAPSGEEWSQFYTFIIEQSAFPDPITVTRTVVQTVEKVKIVERWIERKRPLDNQDSAAASQWFLIGRFAESILSYSAIDRDTGVQGSGSALNGSYSAELRWRPKQTSLWSWSGAINFEVLTQQYKGQTFSEPRGYARAFYLKRGDVWGYGPLFQAGAGKSGVFINEGSAGAIQSNVFRPELGLGAAAVLRPGENFLFSAIGLVRMDFGGSPAGLPGPLASSLGFETGFGIAVSLSSHWMIESRVRAVQENFSWKPTNGGPVNSSYSNLFMIFDAGLGYRF